MRKLAVSATDAGPARSTAMVLATLPVAGAPAPGAPSRPRTFYSKHEHGHDRPSQDKRAG